MRTNQEIELRRDHAVARAIAYSSTFIADKAQKDNNSSGTDEEMVVQEQGASGSLKRKAPAASSSPCRNEHHHLYLTLPESSHYPLYLAPSLLHPSRPSLTSLVCHTLAARLPPAQVCGSRPPPTTPRTARTCSPRSCAPVLRGYLPCQVLRSLALPEAAAETMRGFGFCPPGALGPAGPLVGSRSKPSRRAASSSKRAGWAPRRPFAVHVCRTHSGQRSASGSSQTACREERRSVWFARTRCGRCCFARGSRRRR